MHHHVYKNVTCGGAQSMKLKLLVQRCSASQQISSPIWKTHSCKKLSNQAQKPKTKHDTDYILCMFIIANIIREMGSLSKIRSCTFKGMNKQNKSRSSEMITHGPAEWERKRLPSTSPALHWDNLALKEGRSQCKDGLQIAFGLQNMTFCACIQMILV